MNTDKTLGCILGGAIGDALGAPIEFLNYDEIIEEFGAAGVTGYVEHPNGKGEFTDDTQMLLFTAEGLLRAYHRQVLKGIGGAHTVITHFSYLRWLKTQGYEDQLVHSKDKDSEQGWLVNRKELFKQRYPGNTCLSSLRSGRMGSIENPVNDSKGCGTVMRIAPAGLLFRSREVAFEEATEISAITHGHPSGYLSGGLLAAIIADVKQEIELEEAIENGLRLLKKRDGHEEVLAIIQKTIRIYEENRQLGLTLELIKMLGEGWVAEEALAISLLCALFHRNDFRKAVLASINHGGDSDSTGAVTGNIVGLMVGSSNIPTEWKENLLYKDIVEQMAEDLSIGCKSLTFDVDKEWLKKYPPF